MGSEKIPFFDLEIDPNLDEGQFHKRKMLINTINAYSFYVSRRDNSFREALQKSDMLIPDGIGIVYAVRLLLGKSIRRITGADLFFYEMNRLQGISGKVFFLGSTEDTLLKIKEKASKQFPDVKVETYSPPYKSEFTIIENTRMVNLVNAFKPDVLFVGMTAPKQEKWAFQHLNNIDGCHVACIGAVFDFYSGTINRAPYWMIKLGLEWFYRLVKEPKRLWKRYFVGNTKFIYYVLVERFRLFFTSV